VRIENEIQFHFQDELEEEALMSYFRCALSLVLSLLGLTLPLAGQQTSVATPGDLIAQLAHLSALIEKQQQEIDALKRSQAELLQELRGSRSQSSTPQSNEVNASTENSALVRMQSSQDASGASDSRRLDYAQRGDQRQGIHLGDRVRLGGYGSVRFETNDVASGNNVPGGSAAGFTFRRLVLTGDARPASRLRVYTEVEFERLFEIGSEKRSSRVPGSLNLKQTLEGNNGGELALEQAWGQPGATWGAGFTGSFNVGQTGKLDYQIYALNGTALDFNLEHELTSTAGSPGTAELVLNSELQLTSGFFDGSKSATAFAWRASYSPTLRGEFAISGYHGKYAPSFLSFRESLTTLAYDHKWRWKGFETEAEAVYTSLGNLNNVLTGFAETAFNSANSTIRSSSSGGLTSATVEMELANLSRRRYGFWTDFKYHARPRWLKDSFLGESFEDPQIIPILRYERVWLNGVTNNVNVSGFGPVRLISFTQENLQQERVTAGISYRPVTQFAMQAAYEHNRRVDGSQLIFPRISQDSTNGLILGMSFGF
jgi:hypothetical protein